MNWGQKMLISFIVFAMGIVYLAYRCMQVNTALVTKEYYKDELKYQDVIDGTKMANALSGKIELIQNGESISVQLPAEMKNEKVSGNIWFYCASDVKKTGIFASKQTHKPRNASIGVHCCLDYTRSSLTGTVITNIITLNKLLLYYNAVAIYHSRTYFGHHQQYALCGNVRAFVASLTHPIFGEPKKNAGYPALPGWKSNHLFRAWFHLWTVGPQNLSRRLSTMVLDWHGNAHPFFGCSPLDLSKKITTAISE